MKTIDELIEKYERIAGEWSGEEPGKQEEEATRALEIVEKLKEVKELVNE